MEPHQEHLQIADSIQCPRCDRIVDYGNYNNRVLRLRRALLSSSHAAACARAAVLTMYVAAAILPAGEFRSGEAAPCV